ncbi:uncharacterized protein AAES06_005014 [Glossophaga mutica]
MASGCFCSPDEVPPPQTCMNSSECPASRQTRPPRAPEGVKPKFKLTAHCLIGLRKEMGRKWVVLSPSVDSDISNENSSEGRYLSPREQMPRSKTRDLGAAGEERLSELFLRSTLRDQGHSQRPPPPKAQAVLTCTSVALSSTGAQHTASGALSGPGTPSPLHWGAGPPPPPHGTFAHVSCGNARIQNQPDSSVSLLIPLTISPLLLGPPRSFFPFHPGFLSEIKVTASLTASAFYLRRSVRTLPPGLFSFQSRPRLLWSLLLEAPFPSTQVIVCATWIVCSVWGRESGGSLPGSLHRCESHTCLHSKMEKPRHGVGWGSDVLKGVLLSTGAAFEHTCVRPPT